VSVKSAFERQLNWRQLGFAYKIPDSGPAIKPFDYFVAIPTGGILRFVAIEAKKADGWTLNRNQWQSHQRYALDILSGLDADSAWVAIGFLDIPNMKLDHSRKKMVGNRKKEAYLIRWIDYLSIEGESSALYDDIASRLGDCSLAWGKYKNSYCWLVPKHHPIIKNGFTSV